MKPSRKNGRSPKALFYLALLVSLLATGLGLAISGDLTGLVGEGAATVRGASTLGVDEDIQSSVAGQGSGSESGLADITGDEVILPGRELAPPEDAPTEDPPVEDPVEEFPDEGRGETPTDPPVDEKVDPPVDDQTEEPPEDPVDPPEEPQDEKVDRPSDDKRGPADEPVTDGPDSTTDDEERQAPATVSLTADPTGGSAPLEVTFDGSSDHEIVSYALDFGDGESTGASGVPDGITHTYTETSSPTAVLTVVTADGQEVSDSVNIDVSGTNASPSPPGDGPDTDDESGPGEQSNDGSVLPDQWLNSDPTSAQGPSVNDDRSDLVSSVHDPTELDLSVRAVTESLLLAALLMLLVGFPSEMFNATLLENYEEISGWFSWSWLTRLRNWMANLNGVSVALGFSAIGALIHSQLEPHFGFDRGSLALLLGLFLTFLIISVVYDVMRRMHLHKRHDLPSRLRAQMIGMVVAVVFVVASRLGHFHPGYMYGLFTALAYGGVLHESHHGRALAKSSVRIFMFALAAWLLWIPVKHMAEEPAAGFWILTLDAMLAVLWVAGVATIVFGLAPLRFFYGETVKAWSFWGWAALWGSGVVVFVYTLLHPERGLYGTSEEASLASVMSLFIGFGVFSLAFWGYFRLRELRKRSAAGATQS